MDKKTYTWGEVENMSSAIAAGARSHNFTGILAISRGGLMPAYFIASRLGIKRIGTICMSSYENGVRGNLRVEMDSMQGFHKGEKILIVDDICDTGETLDYVKNNYLKYNLGTATLVNKNQSNPPDFYAETMSESIWAVFPWERYEDVENEFAARKKDLLFE